MSAAEMQIQLPNASELLATPGFNEQTGELTFGITHNSADWQSVTNVVTNGLRQVIGDRLTGVLYRSSAYENSYAYHGPFPQDQVIEGESGTDTEQPVFAVIVSDADVPIRHATHLEISENRAAEIADGYVLPGKLRYPDNPTDALIGYVIGKLAGEETAATSTPYSMGEDAQRGIIEDNWALTFPQAKAIMMASKVAMSDAEFNATHRAYKLEELEHVLRYLITREYRYQEQRESGERSVSISTDYSWATGVLAEALAIVNGINGFVGQYEPNDDMLTMGALPKKHVIEATDDAVLVRDGTFTDGKRPIWPPEAVHEFNLSRALEQKKATLDDIRQRAEDAAEAATRQAERDMQDIAIAHARIDASHHVLRLGEAGFEWHGIQDQRGPIASDSALREYLTAQHPNRHIRVLAGYAVYAGTKVVPAPGQITVFTAAPVHAEEPYSLIEASVNQ